MIGRTMTSLKKHLFRRGQTGQALAILAIGFIALCAFVGIVTDVSLLFVRYSTLRRAVDAAAVAAAGQMRRDPNYSTPGEEQAASIAHMNLAARQFIEVYGLNPSNVLVETCQIQHLPTVPVGNSYRPADRTGVELYRYVSSAPNAARVPDDPGTPQDESVNPAANVEDLRSYEQLCKDREMKLVRVTAQIEAPTIFLRLLGFSTITLTESSISQTAALDVVLILDVSESMTYETTYHDWEDAGYWYRYVPAFVYPVGADAAVWPYLLSHPLNNPSLPASENILTVEHPLLPGQPWFGMTTMSTETVPASLIDTNGVEYTGPMVAFLPDGAPGGTPHTREFCQVRVAPMASGYSVGSGIRPWLYDEYVSEFGSSWVNQRFRGGRHFRGFAPMYDSYACCNDPDGDFRFDDLVCQPFQQVRVATNDFLSQLDFIRGDRVVFVTFDHTATIIDPDGTGPQRPMIETQFDFDINGDSTIDTTINERYGAETVLREVMGVRAETTYYDDSDNNGRWDGLIDWDPDAWDPAVPGAGWTGHDYNYFQTTIFGNIYVQPFKSSCFLDRAVLREPLVDGLYHERLEGHVDWPLITEALNTPTWYYDPFLPYSDNYFADPDQRALYNGIFDAAVPHLWSAEYRGGCGGGNIGSGLGRAQQALVDDGRIEGAIWLMVLLSDGASGASDPIAQDIQYHPTTGQVTGVTLQYPDIFTQYSDVSGPYYDPQPGYYGAFGVCPYGTGLVDDPATTTVVERPGEIFTDWDFPYCLDEQPETRHFCSQMPIPPTVFELNDASGTFICDDEFYDTDDYAHDWADWVALANLPTHEDSPITRNASEQLPTIFTIGIGLDFPAVNAAGVRVCPDEDWQCRATTPLNLSDYLGEQLLRYIADVGDNAMLDDDYWQCFMTNRIPAHTSQVYYDEDTDTSDCSNKILPNWGPRGPCEIQDVAPIRRGDGNFANWLPPMTSCGNYFSASNAGDLDGIFGVIASRMFTRLSQ